MSPSLPPTTLSPWASLPEDMIRLVAGRLLAGDLTDYVRLRAVCTNWRSSTVSPRGRGVIDPRFHPRRWMMFAEGHGLHPGHENLGGHIRFFNLDSGIFVRVRLPLLTDHCVLDSVEGLLVLQRDEDTAIRLLHPFTGDIVELPPLTSLAMQLKTDYTEATKLKLMRHISASISVADDGVVRVMVILIRMMRAAVATSQDTEWSMLSWRVPSHYQPLSTGGKQYLVHDTFFEDIDPDVAQVFQMEAHLQDTPKLIATIPREILAYPVYLVECDSEVLVVGHNDMSFTHLAVHRLSDLVSERYVPVKGIGDKVIFVGGRALCVSSKILPPTTGNAVIYQHPRELTFSQYCLGSSTWWLATDECSMSMSGLTQGPCSLIPHVFTCCSRRHWNKGLMYWRDNEPLTWKVKQKFRDGA
ncbi:unnamed protein product [Triticum turgidum subsp. durum]|uniref:KIB1-4 beta-propeller domain-containing protein n=1 Tax=Triticum turgidum subsp. durum TaxID=4567 RepID=A0A9R0SR35_TRITD|nr:unnamed protein product [Triticum turgidum subsp. durum]